jgi:hypothetical protein
MGMVFGIGRKDARDMQDAQQPDRVPYRLASYDHDHEGKRYRSSKVVYSFWSASKYVLILSLILWWLPMFGQMIAGYVGGRRAGSPWRGVAASILPVVCLYMVMTGFDSGFLPSHVLGVAIAPAAISAALTDSAPFISPYIQFSSEYVGSFVDALAGASPYGINTYILTIAFAYVGGILAEQSRREIEFNSGAMMANTTVLVADGQQQLPAAQYPYPQSHHGLAHMISAAFPWSRHPEQGHPHAYAARGHANWAGAVPMRFDDGSQGYMPAEMLPPAEMDAPLVYSRATTRSRQTRAVRAKVRKEDPWRRANRRVKHTYVSARRFADEPEIEEEARHARPSRPSRHGATRIVPGDARSVKRARRTIDTEWGRKRYPTLDDRPTRRVRNSEPEDDSDEPQQPKHVPRPPVDHWDAI